MRDIRLVQFTDTHLFGDGSGSLRGIATQPSLQQTLAHARSAIAAADAILVTGDLVQDDPSGYAQFRGIFAHLGKPVLCIPGNHDDPAAMRRALRAAPFQIGGFRDFGNWRVVLLDTSLAGSAAGRLAPNELKLLDQSLAGAAGNHVLVCLHHHPVPMRSRWLDTVGLTNAADFFAVLDRYDNVRAALWGHVHQEYDGARKGVRLLSTPSTCTQFLPLADDFATDPLPPAYRQLQLSAAGQIQTEVTWTDRTSAADSSQHSHSAA